jgi:hypothetical protein
LDMILIAQVLINLKEMQLLKIHLYKTHIDL